MMIGQNTLLFLSPHLRLHRLLCALLLVLLNGCGSGDDFPGSAANQEPDPLVTDVPMFYIERPLRMQEDDADAVEADDLLDPIRFHGGARLYMKIRAAQSVPSVDLSARAASGNLDVRDLDISPDGKFLVFALRGPGSSDQDDDEIPTWNLWEYAIEDDDLHRVIQDDNLAEKGHDITPRYLPDGRIIFASTRQQKSRSILQDEGKDQFSHLEESRQRAAFNLHVIDPRTQEISQVTFNQSDDLYPAVMSDGKIVYSRWDNAHGGNRGLHLYEMNPDGTQNQLLYGRHSHATGNDDSELQFVRSNLMPDGDLFVLARPRETPYYGGNFLRIDTARYSDNVQPVNGSSGSGPAQTAIIDRSIFTDGESISPGGYFSAFFPLWDNTDRALVSWSQCRVLIDGATLPCTAPNLANPAAEAARPAYGLWVYNYRDNTQVPVVIAREDIVYTDVALGAARTAAPIRYDGASLTGVTDGKVSATTFSNMVDAENEEAILHIRSVYDLNGTFTDLNPNASLSYSTLANPSLSDADDRPARFLRIEKAVSEPDRELADPAGGSFGNGGQRMKEIIGYAPIEPDGSVKVKVPANVALLLSVTDAAGKRLTARHLNWISLRPGEVMECKGCHTAGDTGTALPAHGRYDAQADSINEGQPAGTAWPGATGTLTSPFANASMAEARVAAAGDSDNDNDILELSTDLLYTDVWTDTGSETADASLSLSYADLTTPSPANAFCTPWTSRCRIVIHYETHIQPVWALDRGTLTTPILATHHEDGTQPATCIRCHNATAMTANADSQGAPPTQLELTDEVDGGNGVQNRAYVELFNRDVAKVVSEGNLTDCTREETRVDENGDDVLDDNGDPIIDTVTCDPSEGPYLSAAGARSGASASFFALFETGSHANYLTPAELRLIAEWLDIGAQYYNDHFAAPEN